MCSFWPRVAENARGLFHLNFACSFDCCKYLLVFSNRKDWFDPTLNSLAVAFSGYNRPEGTSRTLDAVRVGRLIIRDGISAEMAPLPGPATVIDIFRGCFLIFFVVSSVPDAYCTLSQWERDLLVP
jgi:hypothetical protein